MSTVETDIAFGSLSDLLFSIILKKSENNVIGFLGRSLSFNSPLI
jgi:hypothetical protein